MADCTILGVPLYTVFVGLRHIHCYALLRCHWDIDNERCRLHKGIQRFVPQSRTLALHKRHRRS